MQIYHVIFLLGIFLVIILVGRLYISPPVKVTEKLINLDESVKTNLRHCCSDKKCYDKPDFLQGPNCEINKLESSKNLNKVYDVILTDEKYLSLLNSLNIPVNKLAGTDIPIDNKQLEYQNIKLSNTIDEKVYNKILEDKTYVVNGYDIHQYSPYNTTTTATKTATATTAATGSETTATGSEPAATTTAPWTTTAQ